MKNVVIISSDYTGHGHKSISEALQEQFCMHEDVCLNIIDGFELGGNMWIKVGKSYGMVTRNAKEIWKLAWKISKRNPAFIHEFTELTIRENFIKLLRKKVMLYYSLMRFILFVVILTVQVNQICQIF